MHANVLRYLDEAARQGSIRKAAKMLNISSTSVNRQLLALEMELGVNLFDRSPEGVHPTAAGDIILEHSRKTLLDFDRARSLIQELRDMATGEIRVWFVDSFAVDIMPMIIGRFNQTYPGVVVSAITASPAEINAALVENECDIGMSFNTRIHPDLRIINLKPSPIGVILRSDHPLVTRDYVAIGDLEGSSLVRTNDARFFHSSIDELLDIEASSLKANLFTNDLGIARQAIQSSNFVGIYTKIGFRKDIDAGHLAYVPLSHSELSQMQTGLIVSAQKSIDTVKHQFLSAAGKVLAPLRFDR